ncbi:MAG: N-formylglutamate amidohydrolase [Alphaproteobacteria bacterium]|nr:N-formylglutamate amidohydrolase [Alphaproteobacteria bacterium]
MSHHLESVEVLEGPVHAGIVLTCEHASNALPEPWVWPEHDRWLVDTHWAYDLGIAEVTRELARELEVPAVLSRYSRLLCDVNRPVDAETTFRPFADGRQVWLNHALTDAERQSRIDALHRPFHAAVDHVVERTPRAIVLSMHSFTPVYEAGPPRPMEIGVLFDREEALAHRVAEALEREGWKTALNEPYSGRLGLIYSAARHAERHGRAALELEVRNDVACDLARRSSLLHGLRHALNHAGLC